MVRLSIALALAAALTLAGVAVEFAAYLDRSPVQFLVGAIATTAGLIWIWAVVNEWRTKSRRD
jgi:hypothetical protein